MTPAKTLWPPVLHTYCTAPKVNIFYDTPHVSDIVKLTARYKANVAQNKSAVSVEISEGPEFLLFLFRS